MSKVVGCKDTLSTHTIGELVFKGDGTVIIGNRAFVDSQPIRGHAFAGGTADRRRGFAETLMVHVPSERRRYFFQYRYDIWWRLVPTRNPPPRTLSYSWRRDCSNYGFIGAAIIWAITIGFRVVVWFVVGVIGLGCLTSILAAIVGK
jgi:hypothetical protein